MQYVSQLIQYSRARGSYHDFLDMIWETTVPKGSGKPLRNIGVTNDHGYIPIVRYITELVTRVARRVPLVEQELLIRPEHLSSTPVFSEVHVARSLVFCVVFWRSLNVLLFFFIWL